MMTPTRTQICLGVLSLAAVGMLIGAAEVFHAGHMAAMIQAVAGFAVFGAVTVTYQYPVTGVTAPDPADFPNGYNSVRGVVAATADGDTTATITHNFDLSTAELAAGQPEFSMVPLKTNFYTSTWIAAYTSGDVVTLTKGTGGGSGVAGNQLGFFARRPHSIAI